MISVLQLLALTAVAGGPTLTAFLDAPEYFVPAHRLSGLGVDREHISKDVLARRTELMIDSQTFSILRDSRALAGAKRITSPKMRAIFERAARGDDSMAATLSAIAYLESWGVADAESPTGPKGIMQISEATSRSMGLRMIYGKRYRVVSEKKLVKRRHGKPVTRTVRHKIAYSVLLRDERLTPALAIAAADRYLVSLEDRYGGRDWAIFAYHCGQGCVDEFLNLAQRAHGVDHKQPTVPEVFFGASPAFNRDLYFAVRANMERDYSPTYWFRIKRAEQLLALYERDPAAFEALMDQYRYEFEPAQRAPNRLAVWLKQKDLLYRTADDLHKAEGHDLVRAFDDPKFFGYDLARSSKAPVATIPAVGTLTYIAFETHRLFDEVKPKGEKFVPLPVTALASAAEDSGGSREFPSHATGQVFDVAYGQLPSGEQECLRFILDDMGWDGYLGFIEESSNSNTMHIGCSPSSREFFTKIYEDALAAKK